MTWDPIWERVHQAIEWGGVPLPSFLDAIRRRCNGSISINRDMVEAMHVLDIGCGGGAVTVPLASHGFQVHAFDASQTAVLLCQRRLDEVKADVRIMQATEILEVFGPESMDWVIDIATLQHNPPEAQRDIVRQIQAVLKPGGWVYSRMVAAGSWGEGTGVRVAEGTWTDITEGPAFQRGVTHFATRQDILDLWGSWLDMEGNFLCDHRMPGEGSYHLWPKGDGDMSRHWWMEWIIEGRKPE